MASIDGDIPRPEGPFAEALVWPHWPAMSETGLGDLADEQRAVSKAANDYGDQLMRDMAHQSELLKGYAGDAHQRLMARMRDHAYAAADHFASKVITANGYRAVIYGLKAELTQIVDAAERNWAKSGAAGTGLLAASAAAAIAAKYQPEVDSTVAQAWADFHTTPQPNAPPVSPVVSESTTRAADYRTEKTRQNRSQDDPNVRAVDTTTRKDTPPEPGAGKPPKGTQAPSEPASSTTDAAPKPGTGKPGDADRVDHQATVADSLREPSVIGRPAVPLTPSLPGAGLPASPSISASPPISPTGIVKLPALSGNSFPGVRQAPSFPSAPTTPNQSVAVPFVRAGDSFQSGVASGFSSSGALSPTMPTNPAEPIVSQPLSAHPVTPTAGGNSGLGPAHGNPSAAAIPVNGGPLAPGGSVTGTPLPPFVAQGGGHSSPPVATATASTASPGGPPTSQQSPAQGPAFVTSASGGTVAGTLPDPDANPDLLTAGKVLEGLIRGADAAPQWTYTAFAVGVLRTDWGAQTIIATDTGGGAWLPATVYLPSSARLATVDPTLPMGWGHRFMGWERPTDILIAHCEEVSRTASGVSLSAIATTDAFATIPTSVDSTVFNLRDVLRTPGEAPILDSTHRHRLAAVDTELARRCAAFKEGTDLSTWAATQLTVAIMQAAQIEGPVAGLNLVHPNDIATLLAVPAGNADWDAYVKHLGKDRTDVLHPSCRPHDLDDSPTTVNLRALYQHRFRAGRIVELVLAWRVQPASVRDVVYCALMAGFGANAAAALTKIEATAQ